MRALPTIVPEHIWQSSRSLMVNLCQHTVSGPFYSRDTKKMTVSFFWTAAEDVTFDFFRHMTHCHDTSGFTEPTFHIFFTCIFSNPTLRQWRLAVTADTDVKTYINSDFQTAYLAVSLSTASLPVNSSAPFCLAVASYNEEARRMVHASSLLTSKAEKPV